MASDHSSDGAPTDSEHEQPRGFPSWAVALALVCVVAVLFAAALVLNARLRPPVGTEAIATPVRSLATATIAPSPASSPAVAVTGSNPTQTTDPNAERAAVTQAYLQYWDVYDKALQNLDSSHLSEVATGAELTRAQQFVAQLQTQHQALRLDVTHHEEVTILSPSAASVNDTFVDRAVALNNATGQPIGTPGPATNETIGCRMELIAGVWKVVQVVRIDVTVVHQ